MTENKPMHAINYGAVRAAIWRNDTLKGIFYDVSFQRRYREGETWTSSYTFGARDLPILAKAALDAHTWIHSQAATPADTTQNVAEQADEAELPW